MTGIKIANNPFDRYDNGILVKRVLATIVDYFFLFLFSAPIHFITESLQKEFPSWIVFLFFLGYFIFFEGYYGATPGKFLAKIRVVDLNVNSPGLKRAIIRTLTRILEVNPILFGCLPSFIITLSSQSKQRMGDIIAQTHVLRLEDVNKLRNLLFHNPDPSVKINQV